MHCLRSLTSAHSLVDTEALFVWGGCSLLCLYGNVCFLRFSLYLVSYQFSLSLSLSLSQSKIVASRGYRGLCLQRKLSPSKEHIFAHNEMCLAVKFERFVILFFFSGEFTCGVCFKRFCHAASLNRHRLNFHSGNHHCNLCNQEIPSKSFCLSNRQPKSVVFMQSVLNAQRRIMF